MNFTIKDHMVIADDRYTVGHLSIASEVLYGSYTNEYNTNTEYVLYDNDKKIINMTVEQTIQLWRFLVNYLRDNYSTGNLPKDDDVMILACSISEYKTEYKWFPISAFPVRHDINFDKVDYVNNKDIILDYWENVYPDPYITNQLIKYHIIDKFALYQKKMKIDYQYKIDLFQQLFYASGKTFKDIVFFDEATRDLFTQCIKIVSENGTVDNVGLAAVDNYVTDDATGIRYLEMIPVEQINQLRDLYRGTYKPKFYVTIGGIERGDN